MTDPINGSSGVSQADYLKLFMQELTYQDPLKPVDNKEFMAQMAQFSSLQEARTTNEHLTLLLGMTSGNQALSLLGKQVKIKDRADQAQVMNVKFKPNQPPILTVSNKDAPYAEIEIGQIEEVLN